MTAKQYLFSLLFGFTGALLFSVVRESILPQAFAKREQVITASAFNLVDDAGKLRAQIGFAKEGPPAIWLFDNKGIVRATMGLYQDGSGHIGLQDEQGQMIELLRSFGPQSSPLLIFKQQGQDKMITGINPGTNSQPFLLTIEGGQRKVHFGKYDGP